MKMIFFKGKELLAYIRNFKKNQLIITDLKWAIQEEILLKKQVWQPQELLLETLC